MQSYNRTASCVRRLKIGSGVVTLILYSFGSSGVQGHFLITLLLPTMPTIKGRCVLHVGVSCYLDVIFGLYVKAVLVKCQSKTALSGKELLYW